MSLCQFRVFAAPITWSGLNLSLVLLPFLSGCAELATVSESANGARQVITWNTHRRMPDWPTDMALSPNGETLAVASRFEHIRLFDTETRRRVKVLTDHVGSVLAVAYSPDGNRLVSGGDDLIIRIWDVKQGRVIRHLHGHREPISDIAFSPDGKYIASASHDQTLRLWDARNGKQVRVFYWEDSEVIDGDIKSIYGISFSPDGSHIAAAGTDGVRLWQAASGQLVVHHVGSRSTDIAFSSDQGLYATNGGNNPAKGKGGRIVVSVWSYLDHRLVAEFIKKSSKRSSVVGQPSHILFTPDNQRLLLVGSGVVYWRFQSKSDNDFHGFEGFPFADLDNVTPPFVIYGDKILIPPVRYPAGIGNIGVQPIYSPDGKILITRQAGNERDSQANPTVRFWNVATGQKVFSRERAQLTIAPPYRKKLFGLGPIAVSGDGKWLSNNAGIWNLDNFNSIPFCNGQWLRASTFSHNSQFLVAGFKSPEVVIWDTSNQQERYRIPLTDSKNAHGEDYARTLQLDRGDENLIVVNNKNVISLFDVEDGDLKWRVEPAEAWEEVKNIIVSPDNSKLFVASVVDEQLGIDAHDLRTGKPLSRKTLTLAHSGYVRGNTGVRFSSDGLLVAVSYPMHHIRLTKLAQDFVKDKGKVTGSYYYGATIVDVFYAATGERIKRIELPHDHDHAVTMAFVSESKMIAVGAGNTLMWLFDISSGKLVKTLKFKHPRQQGSIQVLEFSPARKWLFAAAGIDSRMTRVFDLNTGDEITRPAVSGEWVEWDNRDMHGRSPLHHAVMGQNIEDVNRFLKLGADVNASDGSLMTPLHMAAQKANLEIAKILVDNGAHLNAQNNYKWTPLDFAKKSGYVLMIEYLESIGATGIT